MQLVSRRLGLPVGGPAGVVVGLLWLAVLVIAVLHQFKIGIGTGPQFLVDPHATVITRESLESQLEGDVFLRVTCANLTEMKVGESAYCLAIEAYRGHGQEVALVVIWKGARKFYILIPS